MSEHHGIRLDYMDRKANPGVDFFRYVNGAYLDTAKLPVGQARWGVFDELHERALNNLHTIMQENAARTDLAVDTNEQRIGDFYASGMDTDAIEAAGFQPLVGELAAIGRLRDVSGLPRLLARLHGIGVDAFFGFGAMQSFDDSSMQMAVVAQGGLSLPNRDYYIKDDEKSVARRAEFVAHVSRVLQLVGESPKVALRHANSILTIETALAHVTMPPELQRDPANINHPMKVEELQKLLPQFSFTRYFRHCDAPVFDTVNVLQPDFVKALDASLTEFKVSEVKAYLRWQVLNSFGSFLSSAFVDEKFSFWGKVMSGLTEQRPRWKRVAGTVDGALGEALGQVYVARYFPPQAKARALEMIKNLVEVLRQRILALPWMTDATKKGAIAKLNKINFKIGYPDKWKDYSSLHITRDSYVGNVIAANAFGVRQNYEEIGKPVDRSKFGMTPQTVNAYADPQNVDVCFPASILQPPFFDPDADDATNYGAILVVIGHELTHLFDDSGAQYDENGNVNNWWEKSSMDQFMKLIALIRHQYSQFKFGSVELKGDNVSGEAAADLGGLTLAYAALQIALEKSGRRTLDGFTDEQRFFISFGQIWAYIATDQDREAQTQDNEHPLGEFRVNGTLANFDAFPTAFGLPDNSTIMLPTNERCRLW